MPSTHPGLGHQGPAIIATVHDIVVIVPVLRRPHRVAPLVADLNATTDRARVMFVVTRDDRPEVKAVRALCKTVANASYLMVGTNRVGDYARKINLAYTRTTEPLMLLAADDLHFHPGWLEAAEQVLTDPAVGVVGTQDLGNRRVKQGLHATHSVVRRTYIDEFGTIDEPGKVLHEGYPHEFVDDEFIGTAIHRGVFAFSHDCIVEHMHPAWGKGPMDNLYRDEPRRMRAGRIVFKNRQHLWT